MTTEAPATTPAAPAATAPAAPPSAADQLLGDPAATAPAGTAPAPAPAAPPATGTPAGAPAAPAPNAWFDKLDADTRAWAANKGYDKMSPDDIAANVAKSYRNLEQVSKLDGSKVLRAPETHDEFMAMAPKLGMPADPAEYEMPVPEGTTADKDFEAWARKSFHEIGLTKAQAAKLATSYNELFAAEVTRQTEALAERTRAQDVALQKEWGAAHKDNVAIAAAGSRALGLTREQVAALQSTLGYDGLMKTMHQIGVKIGDPTFVTNGVPGGRALAPADAQAEIRRLQQDADFQRAYLDRNHSKHAEMNKRWNDLFQQAYPA